MAKKKPTHDLILRAEDVASTIKASESVLEMVKKLAKAGKALEDQIKVAVKEAREMPVKNPDEYETAAEFLKKIKGTQAGIKDRISPLVKKAHECHKAAKAIENAFMKPLDNLVDAIKIKMKRTIVLLGVGADGKENLIDEEKVEKAYQLAEEGKQEEAEALLVEAGYFTPGELPDALPKVKGVTIKAIWRWAVVEEKKVPRKYMIPDDKAIGGIVKSLKAKTDIKGIRVWSEPSLSISAK